MRIKRFIVHQLIQESLETLFGKQIQRTWKRVSDLCFTRAEAMYKLNLLEKSDKFNGSINNYRIVCVQL